MDVKCGEGEGDIKPEEEKEHLKSKLLKVQEKYVNHFLGDQLDMYLEEQRKNHEENMRKNKGMFKRIFLAIIGLSGLQMYVTVNTSDTVATIPGSP